MPAAAVIPAPIAYMKVVAVKKLVVGFRIVWDVVDRNGLYCAYIYPSLGKKVGNFKGSSNGFLGVVYSSSFTLRKLECSKQA